MCMPLSRLQPTEVQSDMPHNGSSIILEWRRHTSDGVRRESKPAPVAQLEQITSLRGSVLGKYAVYVCMRVFARARVYEFECHLFPTSLCIDITIFQCAANN